MGVIMIRWILLLVFATSFSKSYAREPLVFGVVPQQTPKILAERWQPFIDYMNRETGLTIKFETAKDIPTFESRLADGAYDIAYMNPFHFVVFNEKGGYRALARENDKQLEGIIAVPTASGITSVEQLQGMEMAFPAPAAFAATIIPLSYLQQQGVSVIPRYVHSHDSVYLNLARGFFVAGGGIVRTLKAAPKDVESALTVLWKSNGYTPHAFAAHSNVADSDVATILKSLDLLSNDIKNKEVLSNLGFNKIIPAVDSDWDDVRALGITSLSRPHL
jgi:phosphonate transport system substrate-binding protein